MLPKQQHNKSSMAENGGCQSISKSKKGNCALFKVLVLLLPLDWGEVVLAGTVIPTTQLLGALIFAVASITDFADGQIARKQKLVTNFGKFADPLADKMLVMTAFIILVQMGKVPAWVAAIIVCRELAVTGLRLIIVENDGKVMAAELPGKIKTMTQMFAILFLYLNNVFFINANIMIGEILLYICLFFTVYSGLDYFWKSRSIFADSFND